MGAFVCWFARLSIKPAPRVSDAAEDAHSDHLSNGQQRSGNEGSEPFSMPAPVRQCLISATLWPQRVGSTGAEDGDVAANTGPCPL